MALSGRRIHIAWLAAWLAAAALSSCEKPPQTAAEAAQRVHGISEWVADADTCPVDLMTDHMRVESVADFKCSGDALPGCYRRCRRDDVDACYWLAYAVQQSHVDDPAAEVLFQHVCRLGEPSGCVNRAAGMLKAKSEDPQTRQCAARTFERACDFDDIWGCTMTGLAYMRGIGVVQDLERATRALRKSCDEPSEQQNQGCATARAMLKTIAAGLQPLPAK